MRLMILLLLLSGSASAQQPPPANRADFVKRVEAYADEDAAASTPMSDNRAVDVFREDGKAFGLSAPDISDIYRREYRRAAAAPWWKRWWIGYVLAGLALVGVPLRGWIEERLKKFYEELYLHYAWAKPFRRKALTRYRAQLVEHYQN